MDPFTIAALVGTGVGVLGKLLSSSSTSTIP